MRAIYDLGLNPGLVWEVFPKPLNLAFVACCREVLAAAQAARGIGGRLAGSSDSVVGAFGVWGLGFELRHCSLQLLHRDFVRYVIDVRTVVPTHEILHDACACC